MPEGSQVSQAELEAAIRRYVAKTIGRYAPVALVLLAVALLIAFVPSKQRSSSLGGFTAQGSGVSAGGSTAAGPGQSGTGGGAGSQALGAGGGAVGGGAGVGGSSPSPGGSSPAVATPQGITAPAAAGSAGVTRSGIQCGPGVRQVPWSPYAPLCVPAYHGSNGGATAPGVTATTITLSYRIPNSAQQGAINAIAGAANVNDGAYRADLQTYIDFFNSQFELYGRHVVLKAFQGQGDYIAEDQGQGVGQAQADAINAHDMGAFGDVTFPLYSSQFYMQALAAEHVIAFGAVGLPKAWFQQYAPYEYSVYSPDGDNTALGLAQTICRRAVGMPATFTNDPVYSHETRKWGLITPDNAVYQHSGQIMVSTIDGCGGSPVKPWERYTINVADFEGQSVNMVAQLKAAGVTSVICYCDPLVPIFISRAADQQSYHPEWWATYWGDPATRNFTQDQWAHAITTLGYQYPTLTSTEAYKAYQLASPGHHPAEWPPASPGYFSVPYYALMQVFAGLQAAGPDLNPSTFQQGIFSLPPSLPGGLLGMWRYGPGVYDPWTDFTITRWSAKAVSAFDSTQGAWLACNSAARYPYGDEAALGGPRAPLACPPGS